MESLNWAYRGSIAGVLMRTLPMVFQNCILSRIPGQPPNFQRRLPEIGGLYQVCPTGHPSELERDLRRQLEGTRAQAFGLRGLLEHEIRRRREDAAAEGVEIGLHVGEIRPVGQIETLHDQAQAGAL